MGNCIQTEAPFMRQNGLQKQQSLVAYNTATIFSKLQAVEGTLYLYRSILLRNSLEIEKEALDLSSKGCSDLATFAYKRLDLHQLIFLKIDQQREHIKTANRNAEASKSKKECIQVLAETEILLDDIGEIIKLEDLYRGDDGEAQTKKGFEALFAKYDIQSRVNSQASSTKISETSSKEDRIFASIPLTESGCIKKSAIPNFTSSNQLPLPLPQPAATC